MCMGPEVIAMIAAGAQLAGTGMKMMGQDKVNDERRRTMRMEAERQRDFQNRSQAQIAETTQQVGREAQEQEENEATAERVQKMTPESTVPVAGEYAQTNSSAPSVVKGEIGRQIADAVRRGRGNIKNLAKLSAYGDAGFDTQVKLLRSAENIGQIANNAYSSSQVLPFELQDANSAGQGYDLAGDIASGIGSIGMLYANTMPKTGGGGTVVGKSPERSQWDFATGKPRVFAGSSRVPSFYE
jgi:hypothetical protein